MKTSDQKQKRISWNFPTAKNTKNCRKDLQHLHFIVHTMNTGPQARVAIVRTPIFQSTKRIKLYVLSECQQSHSFISSPNENKMLNTMTNKNKECWIQKPKTSRKEVLPSSLTDQQPRISEEANIRAKRESKWNPKRFHLAPIAWWTRCSSAGDDSNYFLWKPRRHEATEIPIQNRQVFWYEHPPSTMLKTRNTNNEQQRTPTTTRMMVFFFLFVSWKILTRPKTMLHTNENPQPYQGPSYQRMKSRLQYPYLQRPHNPVTGSADCNFHQKFIWVELKIETKKQC